MVTIVTETITHGMSLFIPSKTIFIKQRDKPWFTPAIRKLFKACYKLHKRKNTFWNIRLSPGKPSIPFAQLKTIIITILPPTSKIPKPLLKHFGHY